jgi:REP-associated tyrosine transposase
MAQSFVSNNQHIIFSTRERLPLIASANQRRLWAYLGGIAKGVNAVPMAIAGMSDHVQILAALPGDLSIARFVNLLKSNSSKWPHREEPKFGWQRGYATFSVSTSNLDAVTEYIEKQAEHHKKRDFRAEFIALLKKHNVACDPRYVFE